MVEVLKAIALLYILSHLIDFAIRKYVSDEYAYPDQASHVKFNYFEHVRVFIYSFCDIVPTTVSLTEAGEEHLITNGSDWLE